MDYSIEKFLAKQSPSPYKIGTIAIIENTGKSPEDVFINYKIHGEVETMIDTLKNIVEADRTYMQNEYALKVWMFVNLIAQKWYYTILNMLKKHKLNGKYSPNDFLLFLSEVKKVKINNEWHNVEITRETKELLDILRIIPIT